MTFAFTSVLRKMKTIFKKIYRPKLHGAATNANGCLPSKCHVTHHLNNQNRQDNHPQRKEQPPLDPQQMHNHASKNKPKTRINEC
jgi:hypothetical protein